MLSDASSIASSYRVPSTQRPSSDERFSAVESSSISGHEPQRADDRVLQPPRSIYDNVVAPKPQPAPETVRKLLDIIHAGTPGPPASAASVPAALARDADQTPRHADEARFARLTPQTALPSQPPAPDFLALLKSAALSPSQRTPLQDAERREKQDMLLRHLEHLAVQYPVSSDQREPEMFPPPPGIRHQEANTQPQNFRDSANLPPSRQQAAAQLLNILQNGPQAALSFTGAGERNDAATLRHAHETHAPEASPSFSNALSSAGAIGAFAPPDHEGPVGTRIGQHPPREGVARQGGFLGGPAHSAQPLLTDTQRLLAQLQFGTAR